MDPPYNTLFIQEPKTPLLTLRRNNIFERPPNQTAGVVIETLKKCFAQNGVPEIVLSDNGSCFHSHEFKEFSSKELTFMHKTSSPRYPQENGQAEAEVRRAELILAQDDPRLALMTYRETSVQSTGVNPSEVAFAKKWKTNLPILP